MEVIFCLHYGSGCTDVLSKVIQMFALNRVNVQTYMFDHLFSPPLAFHHWEGVPWNNSLKQQPLVHPFPKRKSFLMWMPFPSPKGMWSVQSPNLSQSDYVESLKKKKSIWKKRESSERERKFMKWTRGGFTVKMNLNREMLWVCNGGDVCSAKGG